MGWLDNLTGKNYSEMTDREVGMDALQHFFNYATIEAQKKRHLIFSFNRMIEIIESVKGGSAQINGLGLGIKLVDMGEGDVKDAMKNLAIFTEGRIPSNIAIFREALQSETSYYADKIGTFLDSPVGQVITKTADITNWTIDTGTALVKQTAETAVDILKWRKPLLITAGVLAAGIGVYLLVTRAQDIAEGIGNLKKELKRASK